MKSQGHIEFTRHQILAIYLASGAFAIVGALTLGMGFTRLIDGDPVERTLAYFFCSGTAFFGCIAMLALSLLPLAFSRGSRQIGPPEEK